MENQKMSLEMHNAKSVFEQRPLDDDQIKLVEAIKGEAEALYVTIQSIGLDGGEPESKRLIAMAKTKLEETVMIATKAVSRQYPKHSGSVD